MIELTAPLSGANGVYQPWVDAVTGTVDAINAAGGAHGHKLILKTCDAGESANTTAACGQQVVQNNAVGVIDMESDEQPIEQYLAQKNIPAFGFMVDPVMYTSPISYSTADAGGSADLGVIGLAKKMACKKLVLLRADPQPAAAVASYKANYLSLAKLVGVPTSVVEAQPGTPDMSSYAADALGMHPDCIDVAGYGADEVSLMEAVNQADPTDKVQIFTSPSLVAPSTISSLGKITNRIIGVSFAWDTSTASQQAHPGIKEFVSDMDKYAPKPNQLDNNSEVMWSQTMALASAIGKVTGDVTAAKVKAALDSFHNYDTGIGPAVSFDTPGQSPVPARVFAPYGIQVKWVNGQLTTFGSFFNIYTGASVATP